MEGHRVGGIALAAAATGNDHQLVVGVGVKAVGLLPCVGHSVAVGVEVGWAVITLQLVSTLVLDKVNDARTMLDGLSIAGFCG